MSAVFAESRSWKMVSDPLELELQPAVSCPGCWWDLAQVVSISESCTHPQLLSRISSCAALELTGSIRETDAEQRVETLGT